MSALFKCLILFLLQLLLYFTVAAQDAQQSGVAVLLVDTDYQYGKVSENIYGHFLEHINHSIVDGLFAEQIRGQGFEGTDFKDFWEVDGDVILKSEDAYSGDLYVKLNGKRALPAKIQQNRIFIQEGQKYNGSFWVNAFSKKQHLQLQIKSNNAKENIEMSIPIEEKGWHEVTFEFKADFQDSNAIIQFSCTGNIDIDFISLATSESRANGMLRSDLYESLNTLSPPFIRWPGGSFASIYKWKDGLGPRVHRKFNPNTHWGGYSDYYGFGTNEFLDLCEKLGSEPMIVLKATSTNPEELQYAMDWVHYLIDPPHTEWGKLRADHGREAPYEIPYFQIDNEPMNHGLSAEQYAEIVNLYGSALRKIAPESKILACGQKRSNDMIWSQKVIDMAGENFDILGCHNYEYEPENFKNGIPRIKNYLIQLQQYIDHSKFPDLTLTVLEWGLCRSYDWRAGLHAAGNLITYEDLGIAMSCPALLMRNIEDDPTWTAWIYHDHVSWFPGGGYVVEDLFRDHYAEIKLAYTSGTFKNIEDRNLFFDDLSQHKPEEFIPGGVEAIATQSIDKERIIIKAVNYTESEQTLLTRFQGRDLPENALILIHELSFKLEDKADLNHVDRLSPSITSSAFKKDFHLTMKPYSVYVMELK